MPKQWFVAYKPPEGQWFIGCILYNTEHAARERIQASAKESSDWSHRLYVINLDPYIAVHSTDVICIESWGTEIFPPDPRIDTLDDPFADKPPVVDAWTGEPIAVVDRGVAGETSEPIKEIG